MDIKSTILYKYYFEKYKGKVYKVSKLGNEDWRVDETLFSEIPFVVFNPELNRPIVK